MFVFLTPLTNKAKNKLREAGSPTQWLVTEKREMVGFSDRQGPWLHVIPDNNNKDKSRWVHQFNDTDFIVKEV